MRRRFYGTTLRAVTIASALIGIGAASPAAAQTCDASALLIRNTNVWTRDGIIANRDVTFRNGRVEMIEAARLQRSDRLRTIDGTGHTLLPGLIDSHLHFTIPGGLPRTERSRTDAGEIAGRQLLRSGVTSGRLHLATIEDAMLLKARSAKACEPIPRLQVGGPGLSGGVERDFGNFQGARSRDEAIAKIERFRGAGIDWLAIHDAEKFQPGVLAAIEETARRAGLRLMAAGTTKEEIIAALSVNPDTLDYFDRAVDASYPDDVREAIRARRNLVLVPTPGVPYRTTEYLRNPTLLDRAENFEFFTDADRAFVLSSAKKDLADPRASREQRIFQSLAAKFRQLRQLGLPMAMGSDAGSQLHFQANAIWWELEAWRSLGASHREALTAATENGARVLQLDDIGRIAVGARADFILYRGNVEDGPFDGQRVMAVGKDGVLYVEQGRWNRF